jgi:hypothetical protein
VRFYHFAMAMLVLLVLAGGIVSSWSFLSRETLAAALIVLSIKHRRAKGWRWAGVGTREIIAALTTAALLGLFVIRRLIGDGIAQAWNHLEPRIRAIAIRPSKRREVSAEVQFEVAANGVTDITEPGTARLRIGPAQHWEDHVVARLKLASCWPAAPTNLRLGRG